MVYLVFQYCEDGDGQLWDCFVAAFSTNKKAKDYIRNQKKKKDYSWDEEENGCPLYTIQEVNIDKEQ
jgi:hypothetical protein